MDTQNADAPVFQNIANSAEGVSTLHGEREHSVRSGGSVLNPNVVLLRSLPLATGRVRPTADWERRTRSGSEGNSN